MGYSSQAISIFELITNIHDYYLPAIQREFVWPAEKIERLFDSLLRGYPIGTMLRWDVAKPAIHDFQFYELIRDFDVRTSHNVKANLTARDSCYGILDGQQRITALSIGLSGSYTEKLARLWWNNPDAFPKKKLYLNLLFKSNLNDENRYEFRFLESSKAAPKDEEYWFLVGDIMKYKSRDELRTFYRSTPHKDNDHFIDTLEALWNAIFTEKNLTFFAENRQELDEVLEIFVRLNTGGTPLSYSDLLLSLATATWKTHDAREEVTELVDQLNKASGDSWFQFSKDFVLKAVLVLGDGDVRFRAANIRKKQDLETKWPEVKECLKTVVRLLRSFGMNGHTLTAPNAVLPIAYYLYVRNLSSSNFVTSSTYQTEREVIRVWLLKMLLGRVFGGQSDTTLTAIREVIRREVLTNKKTTFPSVEIIQSLNVRQGFTFTDEQIASLVAETKYGDAYAFALLALVQPSLNFQQNQFHQDHLHPLSFFDRKKLNAAGLTQDEVDFALEHGNYLPNLHLLVGSMNQSKLATPLKDWLTSQGSASPIMQSSLIPSGISLDLAKFQDFFKARETLLVND